MKTILKLAGWLVGAHLLLGGVLLVIEATHGINDQDASFAVVLLFHSLNFPSVWLLRWLGATPGIIAVLLVGIVQWTALAAVIGGGYRAIAGRSDFRRWKWGLWFAGIYLVVSVTCTVTYLMHPHEYSIPILIVRYASLPTVYLLFEVLTPYGRQLTLLPHGQVLELAVVLGLTTLLYFAVGQGMGRVVRRFVRGKAGQKPGSTP
jgi:hypothetical protein